MFDALHQGLPCDRLAVVVTEIPLFTECIQNPHNANADAERVRQALDRRLMMPRLAGRSSVTVRQQCGVGDCADRGVSAVETGLGTVLAALASINLLRAVASIRAISSDENGTLSS